MRKAIQLTSLFLFSRAPYLSWILRNCSPGFPPISDWSCPSCLLSFPILLRSVFIPILIFYVLLVRGFSCDLIVTGLSVASLWSLTPWVPQRNRSDLNPASPPTNLPLSCVGEPLDPSRDLHRSHALSHSASRLRPGNPIFLVVKLPLKSVPSFWSLLLLLQLRAQSCPFFWKYRSQLLSPCLRSDRISTKPSSWPTRLWESSSWPPF